MTTVFWKNRVGDSFICWLLMPVRLLPTAEKCNLAYQREQQNGGRQNERVKQFCRAQECTKPLLLYHRCCWCYATEPWDIPPWMRRKKRTSSFVRPCWCIISAGVVSGCLDEFHWLVSTFSTWAGGLEKFIRLPGTSLWSPQSMFGNETAAAQSVEVA
jgi:hypothetical protein